MTKITASITGIQGYVPDYILTNNRVKQLKMYIPKYFNSKNPRDLMFSDHKPVLSEIVI